MSVHVNEAAHVTVQIDAPYDAALDFLADVANLPRWAVNFISAGRVGRAVELGRLFPQDRDGELDLVQLRHTVQHVDALARGGVYHRADPQSEPPPGLLARVEHAVGAVPGG